MKRTQQLIKYILFPFSILYGIITELRNYFFDCGILKSERFNIPTICIGNLSVGGTGKTPHTEFVINTLKKDFYPAILSRGYKRQTKGFILADENSTYMEVGDEPFQMKQKFNDDVIVAVDEQRVHGINKLMYSQDNIDVVVLDDAFQHRYVKPGLSILLTDYNHLFVHDHMLPTGRLRELKHNKKRADIVVVTKCPDDIKPIDFLIVKKELNLYAYQQLYFSSFEYDDLKLVFTGLSSSDKFKKEKINTDWEILLLTGIVSPKPLQQHLLQYTSKIEQLIYPDHHVFSEKDIENITHQFNRIKTDKKLIVVTEKDAARLINIAFSDEIKPHLYSIGIRVKILQNKEKKFKINLLNYVRKNKREY